MMKPRIAPRIALVLAVVGLAPALLPQLGHGQPAPADAPRARPSDAQIAEWRARRATREPGGENAPTATPVSMSAPESAASPPQPGRPAAMAGGGRPPPGEVSGRPGARAAGPRGGTGAGLWLAEAPPRRGEAAGRGGGMRGMGGMGSMGGMGEMGGMPGAVPSKRLWLRAGGDPQHSGFAHDEAEASLEARLVGPAGPGGGTVLEREDEGGRPFFFSMPVQGFYRAYVESRSVQGETLLVQLAKAEIAHFSHGGDEAERRRALAGPRVLESAPLEIVRERQSDEKPFFQLKSGDWQNFVVLRRGVPLAGVRVRFVSYQGWVKEAQSDEQGRVGFQVVRDYFPRWDDFQKRFRATYLVIAETADAERGQFRERAYTGTRYVATLAGSYYPSPDDYRSLAWGLGIGLTALTVFGLGVWSYRRRRVRPFREVRP